MSCLPERSGPDASASTIVAAWFSVVGCPAVSRTLTTTSKGRFWTGAPNPEAVSVMDTMSREPLAGAASAGYGDPDRPRRREHGGTQGGETTSKQRSVRRHVTAFPPEEAPGYGS